MAQQAAWIQQLQRTAVTTGTGLSPEEALCTALARLDQDLSSTEPDASKPNRQAYADLDGFLLAQLLLPSASIRLQALVRQVLAKLATADGQHGSAAGASAASTPLVDFSLLWKKAVECDENAERLIPVVSACQDEDLLKESVIPQLVRWVSTRGFDSRLQVAALLSLTRIASRRTSIVSDEQVLIISCQLAEWLRGAGLEQATSSPRGWKDSARSIAGGSNATGAATAAVRECDGSPATGDFFTILNVGQFYTDAQVLNMNAYSVLKTWLSSIKVSNVKYIVPLLDAVLDYCSRTLSQAERTATKDGDLALAILVESISLLDIVATASDTHRGRCLSKVKAVDCRDAAGPYVLTAVLQFFLNHAKDLVQPIADRLFGSCLANHFADSSASFEVISFIKKNLSCLCYETNCLKMYFPNIFKVLAWNPQCYLDDFMVILPATMCKQTALELIHLLLDLPCLSAALCSSATLATAQLPPLGAGAASATAGHPEGAAALSVRGGAGVGDGAAALVSSGLSSDVAASLRPWLAYLLRTKSGGGDTIAKLQVLHAGLAGLADHPRVTCTAQASLILVRTFFRHFIECCDYEEASHMLQLLLERVALLYGPSRLEKPMQRLLCDEVLRLLDKHPRLIATHKPDVLSWLVSTKVATTNALVSTHLAWAVGYYCSPSYGEKYTSELMTEFYETMECLVYETISDRSVTSAPAAVLAQVFSDDNVQLLTALLTAMTKLGCRCQDLVPRVLLCITKLSKLLDATDAVLSMAPAAGQSFGSPGLRATEENVAILRCRLRELVNLVNVPDVASIILNMPIPSRSTRPHLDSSAPHALLETLSALV